MLKIQSNAEFVQIGLFGVYSNIKSPKTVKVLKGRIISAQADKLGDE